MYKHALRLKLRFKTEKGLLTAEQLWDLSRPMLGRAIKKVHEELKEVETESNELDFLTSDGIVETADPENTLRFKILKDIFLTRKEEADAKRNAAEAKLHNQKIDTLIARKKDSELEGKTIAELEAMRKA